MNCWIIGSLILWFTDSWICWRLDSLVVSCARILSFHGNFNNHLFRWCTSQLQHFIASASQELSYRQLISYSHFLFEISAPKRAGHNWYFDRMLGMDGLAEHGYAPNATQQIRCAPAGNFQIHVHAASWQRGTKGTDPNELSTNITNQSRKWQLVWHCVTSVCSLQPPGLTKLHKWGPPASWKHIKYIWETQVVAVTQFHIWFFGHQDFHSSQTAPFTSKWCWNSYSLGGPLTAGYHWGFPSLTRAHRFQPSQGSAGRSLAHGAAGQFMVMKRPSGDLAWTCLENGHSWGHLVNWEVPTWKFPKKQGDPKSSSLLSWDLPWKKH